MTHRSRGGRRTSSRKAPAPEPDREIAGRIPARSRLPSNIREYWRGRSPDGPEDRTRPWPCSRFHSRMSACRLSPVPRLSKSDHGESLRQRVDEVERPRERTEAIAHDENKRRPGATDVVSDLDAVDVGVLHRHRRVRPVVTSAMRSALSVSRPSFTMRLPDHGARISGSFRSMSWAVRRRRKSLGP